MMRVWANVVHCRDETFVSITDNSELIETLNFLENGSTFLWTPFHKFPMLSSSKLSFHPALLLCAVFHDKSKNNSEREYLAAVLKHPGSRKQALKVD